MDDLPMNIQWYPGHMAKARRMMSENIKLVDIVCEIIDARIPVSSSNPEIAKIIGNKPRLLIMNRVDLADPGTTNQWRAYFKRKGIHVLETDAKSGKGVPGFSAAVREAMKEKLQKYAEKGLASKTLRAMVVGIPNVGKSTFINKVAKRKAAAASDRPGVTRGKQWISVDKSLELLDTPGLLWPKLEGPETGINLAFTGAVKDDILDIQELAALLMQKLFLEYPHLLAGRYRLELPEAAAGHELLKMAAEKRGFLISGGEADILRMSAVLLDEFRGGKIGRISLEKPGDYDA